MTFSCVRLCELPGYKCVFSDSNITIFYMNVINSFSFGKKREDLTDRSELSELFVSINTPECIHMDLEIFPTPLCRTVPAWRGYVFVVAVVLWVFLFVCLIVWTDGHQPSSHCMDFQLDLSQCFTRPIQNIQNTFFQQATPC